jgi:hypothetical protein
VRVTATVPPATATVGTSARTGAVSYVRSAMFGQTPTQRLHSVSQSRQRAASARASSGV